MVAEVEPLGLDLTDPVGTKLFPGILDLQSAVADMIGDASYQSKLGQTEGAITKQVTRIDVGLSVGVFDWLTVGANVPFVKGRTAVDLAFRADPDADLGVNPVLSDASAVSELLSEMESAAAAAQAYAASVCGAGAGDACNQAKALAAQASSFHSNTEAAYAASGFFPTGGSAAATSLSAALESLNAGLGAAGLPGITAGFEFASGIPDEGGLGGMSFHTVDGLWAMGDVELTASVRLLEGEVRDSGAAHPRWAYSLSGGALVRLGTGTPDDPDVLFDIGSGDGQMDIEGRVAGTLQVGSRFDLWGGFRYGVQDGVVLLRRVAPHEQVLVPKTYTRAVRWTPGSYTYVDLSPRYRLTPELSLAVDYTRYHKAADDYELVGDQPEGLPPVDVADLVHETEMTFQEVGLGVRYSTLRSWREGVATPPMEFGFRVVRAVAGAGGQTPKATRVELSLSVFRRFWGRP